MIRAAAIRRPVPLFLIVAAAYAVGSQLAYSWFAADGVTASFFPAAGVTMAALILTPGRLWPVVIAAAASAEFVMDLLHGIGPAPSLGYVVANVAQPLAGAAVLRLVCTPVDLARTRDLLAFLGIAVVAATAVGAVVGATTFTVLDGGSGWLRFAAEWWVGDGLGVLVVGGAILAVASGEGSQPRGGRVVEAGAILVASCVATALFFSPGWFPLVFAPVVLLVICGFRVGTVAVSLTGAAVAFIAAHATAGGHAYWETLEVGPSVGLLYLQLAIGVVIATALGVAAEVGERERAAVARATAERSREIADAAPAMLWVTGPDGECTYLSRGWFEYTGQAEDEGLGRAWAEALHPDDRERAVAAFLDAAARREEFAIDYRLRRRDGEYRWAIDSGRPRHDATGAYLGYVGSVIDQHDRRLAQEARVESDARYRTLFTSIHEGYALCELVVDEGGTPRDYRFLEANPAFVAMTGIDDPAGRTAMEVDGGEDDGRLDTFAAAALGGDPTRIETHSARLGRWFEVIVTPMPPRGRFALVVSDITARHEAEEALRRSERAERRARARAEFLTQIVSELEAAEGVRARAGRLAALLVPRVADMAVVVGVEGEVIAAVHGDPSRADALASLRASDLPPPRSGRRAGGRARLGVPEEDARVVNGALRGLGPRARLSVTMDGGGGSRVLHLWLTDPGRRPYAADDAVFVEGIADRAGLLLEAARVQEDERATAVRLQRALLPDPVAACAGIEIATRYVPAEDALEVGGDWYDTFPLPDGRIAVAVGDVVGHGLEAAADMGGLRVALGALAPHADGPADLLRLLDGFARGPGAVDFATVCVGVLNPATGEFRYASAGHPPPLVVAADGAARWLDGGRSVPLCAIEAGARPEAVTVLEPGSLLVLYSDGLLERRRAPVGEGPAHLMAVVTNAHREPVEAVCDAVMSRIAGRPGREDDAVVLCMRRLGRPVAPFASTVPATPAQLAPLRRALRTWLAEAGADEISRMDVLLAVGEATANAVEHGFRHSPGIGSVSVLVAPEPDGLRVEVRDDGAWQDPDGDRGDRGRGIDLMRAVGREFSITREPDGTTVALRVPTHTTVTA